jgi:hypothetical protein
LPSADAGKMVDTERVHVKGGRGTRPLKGLVRLHYFSRRHDTCSSRMQGARPSMHDQATEHLPHSVERQLRQKGSAKKCPWRSTSCESEKPTTLVQDSGSGRRVDLLDPNVRERYSCFSNNEGRASGTARLKLTDESPHFRSLTPAVSGRG